MYLKHFCLVILKKEFIALLAIGLLMFGIVTVGNATTYNAFTDFSTISSSGVWSYGEGTTGSNFLLLNRSLSDFSDWGCTDIHGWVSSQGWQDSGFPMVAKKTGIVGERPCDFGATIPGDLLVVAPAGNSTRSDVIIQWKAPATAVYNVSWTFARENNYNTDGIRTLVFKNSTKVYELVLGPGQQTTSSQTLSLNVGDVLSFGVNDVSWGNGDTSGFNAIITSTPYNAFADFSTISSSDVWSYGEGTTGSSFLLLNNKLSDCTDLQGWVSSQGWQDSGLPLVAKKTGIVGEHPCDFGATIPDDLLVVAPAGNSTRSDVIIQWKAQATAVYNVSWTFYRVNNSYSDGVRTLVFKNSTKVYELILSPGQQTTSSQTLSLNAGDVLSFGINDMSWGNGDWSGFNAIITSTPTPPPVVSGSVKTASGTGVSGVLITFSNSGGTATTDVSGIYSVTVANGYSGTATPSKTGYTFSPATRTYSNLTTNQTGQDYTATPPPVTVSGSVKTASGTGVSGVLITFSSGGTATTDVSGIYSATVANGYTGTATPSKTGYTFSPATRTYSNLTADQPGQDYTATPPPVVVSGSVKTASGTGVSGVLFSGFSTQRFWLSALLALRHSFFLQKC